MVVDGAEGGSGKCGGGAREEFCGQRERAEDVSGAHTFYYIRTAAGFFPGPLTKVFAGKSLLLLLTSQQGPRRERRSHPLGFD